MKTRIPLCVGVSAPTIRTYNINPILEDKDRKQMKQEAKRLVEFLWNNVPSCFADELYKIMKDKNQE